MAALLSCLALASAVVEAKAWFGATPPKVDHTFHRRGWTSCALCGGAERLGATVEVGNLRELDAAGASTLLDAVRAHGVVVVKGQNLTRAQQVEFTAALGETVVLPSSFEGKDPEPFHPAIQRITNFWANGTWKGPTARFGAYWHQDGQFWQPPRHNILSILHAQETPPSGGETGFADLRAARHTLSAPLLARAANASIRTSVRQIADFAKGDEEDLAAFPDAEHPVLDAHWRAESVGSPRDAAAVSCHGYPPVGWTVDPSCTSARRTWRWSASRRRRRARRC